MIRILTYNIHKAIGNDGKFMLERIIEILEESQADIICLQEVDYLVPRSGNLDLARRISESLNYHYELGLNVYLKKGAYGNATLSRFPILHAENLNITWGIKKRRGCLMTSILIPEGLLKEDISFAEYKERERRSKEEIRGVEIGVLNFHLGLANFERIWQVRQILASSFLQMVKHMPVILLGDTNDRLRRVDRIFQEAGFFDTCIVFKNMINRKGFRDFYTFPSWIPLIRIDKIFINSRWRVLRHRVIKDKLTKVASDHLPVFADLVLT